MSKQRTQDEGPWGPILDILADDNDDGSDPEPNAPAWFKDWADRHIAAERGAYARGSNGG